MRVGVAFRCWENSVSGGLGGLPLAALVPRGGVKWSADFDLNFSSDPTSVDSGVYTFALFLAGSLKSSLILTASLLCALLKLGYGRLLLDVAPGADAVRASSGTTSAIGVAGFESCSLSFSLSFFRRWGDLTASPVSGSMTFGLELRDDLCSRLASFSAFVRCRLSLGLSSVSLSRSLCAIVDLLRQALRGLRCLVEVACRTPYSAVNSGFCTFPGNMLNIMEMPKYSNLERGDRCGARNGGTV